MEVEREQKALSSVGARKSNQIEAGREGWIRSWWKIALAGAAAIILGLGFLFALYYLLRPLAIFILGITLAASLSPVVNWLSRKMSRVLSIILTYITLFLIAAIISAIIIFPFIQQVQLFIERIPDIFDQLEAALSNITNQLDFPLLETIAGQAQAVSSSFLSIPLQMANYLLDFLLIIFISFYTLIYAPRIIQFILSFFPTENVSRAHQVLNNMGAAMGGYIRGSAIDGIIVGVITYVGLLIIGVDYALVFGLLTGVLEFLPTIGPILAAIPILAVAFSDSITTGLITLIFIVVLQQVEGNILVPNIMRTQAEISPLLSILVLYAGATIGGLLGALLAIPLAAALKVFIIQVLAPAVRRQVGAEEETSQGEA